MMKFLILLGVIAFAAAQNPKQQLDAAFNTLDGNQDKAVVLSEMRAYFDKFDANGDCRVDLQEFAAMTNGSAKNSPEVQGPFRYYDNLDGNTNNYISCDDVKILFNKIDSNGDSSISQHEFETEFPKVEADIQAVINSLKTPVGK